MTSTNTRRSSRLRGNATAKPSACKKTSTPTKEKTGRQVSGAATPPKSAKQKTAPVSPDDEETMSVNSDSTNAADNTTDTVFSPFVTFLSLQIGVAKATKGSEEMRNKIMDLFKILRQADDTIAFSIYKTDAVIDVDTNLYPTTSSAVITDLADIPTSITMMCKYFHGARPNNKGGTIWTQVRMLHGVEIDNIIADTREDFIEKKGRLTIQSIQHWDVATLGFLKNIHPDVDVHQLSAFFSQEMKQLHRADTLKVGLKVKSPYDGRRRDPTKNISYKDRIMAVHVDVEGSKKSLCCSMIKKILSSNKFRTRYNCAVRLVPEFDRNAGPYIQDKVRKCITQHGQFCKCVQSTSCEGIDHLDQMNRPLKKTLRQLILELPDANFINVDLNWTRSSFAILYPIKYEQPAKERIANLGAYLHKEYGDHILQSLPVETQQIIREVTWDSETGRPLSKLDRELDDIIEDGETLEFVDISLITNASSDRPSSAAPSNTFIPQLDSNSVSTFGTMSPERVKKPNVSISPTSTTENDTTTVVSGMTMETKMSHLESRFDKIEEILHALVGKATLSSSVTPPPTSPTAGAEQSVPANGG